ncbi:MAG: DUF4349 domain-containing protein [Clostridiales bacterium]|nr:DUF4349 domain-containing protein [Clostridiales bacterium]
MHNLNIDENEVLRDALSGLNEEVPPMPEELHAAWMQKVEDDMEEKRMEKNRSRRAITRFLSVAAAMVFVVGGTLLTRDDLESGARTDGLQRSSEYQSVYAANDELKLAAYDSGAPVYGAGAANTFTTAARSAGGAMMDEAAPMIVEEEMAAENGAAAAKKIIRTADLTIKTQTFAQSLADIRALCEAEGGWIESSSESQNSSTGLRRAYLTLRIPQDALDGYLTGAEELGRITSRSETATDVTASYQDTQARLNTQKALMERLQALIHESGDLSDLLELESQIADTQYTIDSLQSALNSTDRQVSYATVSINLQEERTPELTDTTVSLGDRIAAALRMGCESLADFALDMLVFLVAALPFIMIVAALAVVVVIVRRLGRRNRK